MRTPAAHPQRVTDYVDKGIELLRDRPGSGTLAEKGTRVAYNARFFLRRGEEVTRDRHSIALYRSRLSIRLVDDVELIDHETRLGKRQSIAGVEKSLIGMREGGYREVLVAPHLAYGASGVEGEIPPHAMLRIELWLRRVIAAD